MKKTLSLLLSLVLMLSLALPASAAETEYPTLEGGVTEIQKYGNIVLDIDPADLKDGGYTYGDLLTVTVNGTGYDMPLCTNYSDVDTGALVLRDSEGVLIAAINMGDFATSNGLAAKVTAEDGWDYTSVSFENDSGPAVTDIENMVTSGCNVILAMVSDSSCDDALRAAQEAGTIVIECGVVTDVYDVSVNSSQYDIGTMISDMAGEWINTQLDGKANIVVYTTYQNQDMQNRGQGIQDRIKELCPDSNILEVVDIGKDVVGAGTTYTDAAATEAVEAVKAAGMNSDDFGIFACDGTESAIKYIADNDVMRGTLMFNSMAEMVRTALYQYLDGELEKGAVVDYSITPITVANVADYVK